MTIQDWAREAREYIDHVVIGTGAVENSDEYRKGKALLATYPEGESGKDEKQSSDRVLLEEAIKLLYEVCAEYDCYRCPLYCSKKPCRVEFIARAAELEGGKK